MSAAWVEAWATVIGAAVSTGAVVLAAIQVRATAKSTREDSEAQTRPYVSLDLVPSIAGAPFFDLVIENFGRTTAKNVSITLQGDEFKPQSQDDEIGPALGEFLGTQFDLAPNARRRVIWRKLEKGGQAANGGPVEGTLSVDYEWVSAEGNSTRYTEFMSFDISEYPKLALQSDDGPNANSGNLLEKAQQNLVHATRAVARNIGELRR